MPKALVTGGAGFIGSHVVDRFIGAGYKTEVIDNLSSGRLANVNQAATLHQLDIRALLTRLAKRSFAMEGVRSSFVHLAAQIDVQEERRRSSWPTRRRISWARSG